MHEPEIALAFTKPETEWVRGRALPKMSPTRDHARAQLLFGAALDRWAKRRGEVGTEWRFRIQPTHGSRRPLVPDVAFVSNAQLRGLSREEMQAPTIPPTVAVEVLSIGDAGHDVADKVEVYLSAGCRLVVIIDPGARTITLHDPTNVRILTAADEFERDASPEFRLRLDTFFAESLELHA